MRRLLVLLAVVAAMALALATASTAFAGSVKPRAGPAPLAACISIEPNHVNEHANVSGVVSSFPCP